MSTVMTDLARLPETSETMRTVIDKGIAPGAILAWRQGDGPIHYDACGSLGFGRTQAVDERSIFRIFSQTKPITGIAAMMLVEDGVIVLDQPLHEILPDFADMQGSCAWPVRRVRRDAWLQPAP